MKYKPQRPAGGWTRGSKPAPGFFGCLGLIFFALAGCAAAIACIALAMTHLEPLLRPLFSPANAEIAGLLSVFAGMVPGFLAIYLIDRLCRRVTGHSSFDYIPDLGVWP